MAKRLIIGCGYLGQRLAYAWQRANDQVMVTTRKDTRAREFAAIGWHPILVDVSQPGEVTFPETTSAVYSVGMDYSTGQSMREIYVEGLRKTLERFKPFPERFIYISSTGVYGQEEGEWVNESSPANPAEESGKIILEAEAVLRELCPHSIILRFAGIYGPGRLIRVQALREGKPLAGNPEGYLNLIHVDDGVDAIIAAEKIAKPGSTYIISDREPIQRKVFYSEMANLLGLPQPQFEKPNQQTPSLPHLRSNKRLQSQRAQDDLGWLPCYPSCREGLAASIAQEKTT